MYLKCPCFLLDHLICNSLVKKFIETTRKKWWYYLPNGFRFGMPTVSTNTGTLAQIDHDRISKKAKIEALQEKAEFQYRVELLQLRMK